jgi:RNA polymerase sigma factor (sigma-70 family)
MQDGSHHTLDQWLPGFRQGSEQSFTKIFEALFPALTWYSYRMTKDQPASEDIVEEAFWIVWTMRERFDRFVGLKAYLYRVVRNHSVDWCQQRVRSQQTEQQAAASVDGQQENPIDALVMAEVFRELEAGVETLPRECRKVIHLFFREGKTPRQIADKLHISIGTVRSQKTRGLLLLKKRLPDLLAIGWLCSLLR